LGQTIISEHRELYSNMGMRIEYTIFLMMRLKSFRPEIDKNWQPRRECQKYENITINSSITVENRIGNGFRKMF
jgi:hypothetical protein